MSIVFDFKFPTQLVFYYGTSIICNASLWFMWDLWNYIDIYIIVEIIIYFIVDDFIRII